MKKKILKFILLLTFETKDKESILEYIEFNSGQNKKPWKKISSFISNTHLGVETTYEDIIRGYNILKEVSLETSIPISAISVDEKFKEKFLQRHMPQALW